MIRKSAKLLAPPILLSWWRGVSQRLRRTGPDFTGKYPDFDAIGLVPAAGFNSESGVAWAMGKAETQSLQAEVTPDVLRLTLLLNILSATGPVTVVDYGGGTGNTFVVVSPHLVRSDAIRWTVSELPDVAIAARAFLGERVSVYEDIDAALKEATGEVVVLARSAVQYHPSPMDLLAQIVAHRPDWVLLTRVPAGEIAPFACVQRFLGTTPQPMWFLNERHIADAMVEFGYAAIDHWQELETFRMSNYMPADRVEHSVGWIFRSSGNPDPREPV